MSFLVRSALIRDMECYTASRVVSKRTQCLRERWITKRKHQMEQSTGIGAIQVPRQLDEIHALPWLAETDIKFDWG